MCILYVTVGRNLDIGGLGSHKPQTVLLIATSCMRYPKIARIEPIFDLVWHSSTAFRGECTKGCFYTILSVIEISSSTLQWKSRWVPSMVLEKGSGSSSSLITSKRKEMMVMIYSENSLQINK